jgi:uncharacterized protein YndB with AHSA1/START domain
MMGRSPNSASTRVSKIVKAPRQAVYQAFLDRDALVAWLPPDGMRGDIHSLEAREGGRFRISLTYQDPERSIQVRARHRRARTSCKVDLLNWFPARGLWK